MHSYAVKKKHLEPALAMCRCQLVLSRRVLESFGGILRRATTSLESDLRLTAAKALLKIDTVAAAEIVLTHFTDMLRLGKSDSLGARDIIPGLLPRLGRE